MPRPWRWTENRNQTPAPAEAFGSVRPRFQSVSRAVPVTQPLQWLPDTVISHSAPGRYQA